MYVLVWEGEHFQSRFLEWWNVLFYFGGLFFVSPQINQVKV